MRVDGVVVQQPTLPVQADQLAARAEPGVQGQDVFLSQGRGQQQFPQVVGEHRDGGVLGSYSGFFAHLGFHGCFQQWLVAVLHRLPNLLGGLGVAGGEELLQHSYGLHGRRRDMHR